jgi:hypothetical protein
VLDLAEGENARLESELDTANVIIKGVQLQLDAANGVNQSLQSELDASR